MGSLRVAKATGQNQASLYAQLQRLDPVSISQLKPKFLGYDVVVRGSISFSLTETIRSLYTRIGNLVLLQQEFRITPASATTSVFYVELPPLADSKEAVTQNLTSPFCLSLESKVTQGSSFRFTRELIEANTNKHCIRVDNINPATAVALNYAAASHLVRIRGAYFV